MMACCRLLLVNGQESITNLVGNAFLCLLDHPEVFERLRHEPAPIYSTIDEVLRYPPPVWIVHRTTQTEVTLGSQHIPAHARISVEIASANRDGKHFALPEQFDIDRVPNRHLSFGDDGTHSCLGVGLTRLVARITLLQVVRQFTELKLQTEQALDVVDNPTQFGVKHLPITFKLLPQSSESL
jgi:cytochrome P450